MSNLKTSPVVVLLLALAASSLLPFLSPPVHSQDTFPETADEDNASNWTCPAVPSFHDLFLLLKSQEVGRKVFAAECLGKTKDPRAIKPLIQALFAEEYARYVQVYERSLREINDTQTAELLVAALKSENTRVRAAYALGKLQLTSGIKPLLVLLASKDKFDRHLAADALGSLNDPQVLDALCNVLNEDEDEVTRRYAASSLGQMRSPKAVDALLEALGDEDDGVRWNAAISLGDIKDTRAIHPLGVLLNDPEENDSNHKAAAEGLAKIGGVQTVAPLASALRDGDPRVRWDSASALAQLDDPLAAQALTNARKDGKGDIVAPAYSFFIRKGDPSTIPLLLKAIAENGSWAVARDFSFCGEPQLEAAGRQWVEKNSTGELNPPDGQSLVWGSAK